MDFLPLQNKVWPETVPADYRHGKNVVVIGGGTPARTVSAPLIVKRQISYQLELMPEPPSKKTRPSRGPTGR